VSAPAKTLCVVVCGAGPAPHVGTLIELAQADGWTVRVVATPAALGFIDTSALEAESGSPVRSDYAAKGQARASSRNADAIIVAPATFNTVNKLALGINDTYALNVVAEAIGQATPIVILPFVNSALAGRQPFIDAVTSLRTEGVEILLGPNQWTPHAPGTGDRHVADFPWHLAVEAANVRPTPYGRT
jgi:phosphopantothenoylcysteine synthetase/decarboxylase